MAADEGSFGEWFRDRRRERGVTQAELAETAGVTMHLVSKIERGHAPSAAPEVLIAWADRLELDRDEVLTRAGKPPPDLVELLKNLAFVRWLRRAMSDPDRPGR